jgi:glyceraldehyde-3-phosphate dehydrogenase (NADP+)
MLAETEALNHTAVVYGTSMPDRIDRGVSLEREGQKMQYIIQRHTLINGEIIKWEGATQVVKTPYLVDGEKELVGEYPLLDSSMALAAVNAAASAYDTGFGVWPQLDPERRVAAIEEFLSQMVQKRDEVSLLITKETAKPLPLSYKEFDRTVEYIHRTISAYRELTWEEGVKQPYGNSLQASIERTPLGTTLCMSPFNYPLNETFTSVIPALIMGNTVVIKPARFGVLLFEPLLEALKECFPPGVVNLVYGDGKEVVAPIIESGKVDTLAFIGSTKAANGIASLHPAPHRLTKVLGLGAHNPAVILEDADLPGNIKEIMAGSLTFNGQRCTTLALHFVDERRGNEYSEMLAKEVSELILGDPFTPGVQITALAEGDSKIEYLKELIADACNKGARIMNQKGGTIIDNIMVPAVLYPVNDKMRIFHEEQFGPIVPIAPFRNMNEVVTAIKASPYGQQIAIFGENNQEIKNAIRLFKNSCARININTQCQRGPDELPFTGKKESGLGTLSIVDALKAFSCPTVISGRG